MKRTYYLRQALLVMALLFIAFFKAEGQTLVLWHADGTTTDVELLTQPLVKFENGKVLITSMVLNMEYPKKDILRFTYKGTNQSGIDAVKAEADYSQKDGQLIFHGIKEADKIAVYNTSGMRLPVNISISGTDACLSLNSIPKGVFLLSVNGKTSKFTRK